MYTSSKLCVMEVHETRCTDEIYHDPAMVVCRSTHIKFSTEVDREVTGACRKPDTLKVGILGTKWHKGKFPNSLCARLTVPQCIVIIICWEPQMILYTSQQQWQLSKPDNNVKTHKSSSLLQQMFIGGSACLQPPPESRQ